MSLYTHLVKTSEPNITGYKIAVNLEGAYYSPATMMQYQIGKVEKPQPEDIYTYENLFLNITNNINPSYDSNMVNKTSVYKELTGAQQSLMLLQGYLDETKKDNLVILEMKISKTSGSHIYIGKLDGVFTIYAGNYITSFSEV